jgi:hypothetical protein
MSLLLLSPPGSLQADDGNSPLQDPPAVLKSWVIGAGGSAGSGAGVMGNGTLGQCAIGFSQGADQYLYSGFWEAWLDWISDSPEPAADPAETVLFRSRPNPFHHETVIAYSLAAAGPIKLTIFDIAGRAVRTLADGQQTAGRHSLVWDGRSDAGQMVSSGFYFCRLQADGEISQNKMIVLN